MHAQAAVVRAALGCLGRVTAAGGPADFPAALRPFGLLLRHSLDERPKVRGCVDAGKPRMHATSCTGPHVRLSCRAGVRS